MANTKAIKPEAQPLDAELGYLTDRQLAALGLEVDTAQQTFEDAALVYAYVGRNPHITQDALVRYAADKWQDAAVERLNAAVTFLKDTGKLIG